MDTGQLGVASMNTDVCRGVNYVEKVNIKRSHTKSSSLRVSQKEVVKNTVFFTVRVIVRVDPQLLYDQILKKIISRKY